GAGGRGLLYRTDDPRGPRRIDGPGPPGGDPARRAGGPRPPGAPDPPRLRREEPAHGRPRARLRRPPGGGGRGRRLYPQAMNLLQRKDVLALEGWDRGEIEAVLQNAASLKEILARPIKKV